MKSYYAIIFPYFYIFFPSALTPENRLTSSHGKFSSATCYPREIKIWRLLASNPGHLCSKQPKYLCGVELQSCTDFYWKRLATRFLFSFFSYREKFPAGRGGRISEALLLSRTRKPLKLRPCYFFREIIISALVRKRRSSSGEPLSTSE